MAWSATGRLPQSEGRTAIGTEAVFRVKTTNRTSEGAAPGHARGEAGSAGHAGDTTTPEPDDSTGGSGSRPPDVLALVVIWCPQEPARVGEVLMVPARVRGGGGEGTFGRGGAEAESPATRLVLARDRPGRLVPSAPVSFAQMSRTQLAVRADGAERLLIENRGRLRLYHNGASADRAEVVPGDVLRLGRQMSFVCVRRPAWIDAMPVGSGYAAPDFGSPDAQGITGESPAAWRLRREIAYVAARPGHVLVVGASGVGKELVARALHALSGRARKRLVSRSAVTFPETLIDAELFGNARGFPNPGMPERPGLVGEADGGTLFLDEIGSVPVALQAHLLRVLDGGEYQRLGDAAVRRADLRLVAATNRPEGIKHDVAARFSFRIDVPDLDARREDIPLLARQLVRLAREQEREAVGPTRARAEPDSKPGPDAGDDDGAETTDTGLSCDLVERLVQRRYLGNVRELRAILWRCLQRSPGRKIEWAGDDAGGAGARAGGAPGTDPRELSPEQIQSCIDRENGVLERVWRELGLSSRFVLHRLIQRHGLTVKRGA
jgi:two-component system nitrogen regulation response regulator GlnG/two-component system response regulator HydG